MLFDNERHATVYALDTNLDQATEMALAQTGIAKPHERAMEKRRQALIWLNRWGYATPQTLAEALGLGRVAGSRLVDQLVSRDLARVVVAGGSWGFWRYEVDAQTGKRERRGPYLVMLSEVGKATSVAIDNTPGAPYERQVAGIQSIRHNLIAQRFTAHLLNNGGYAEYLPEPSARAASMAGQKEPDVVVVRRSDGLRVAVEIELTPKSRQTGALDRALMSVADALGHRFDAAIYVFASQHLADSYESVWQSGNLPIWVKRGSRFEPNGEFRTLSDEVRMSVAFMQSDLLLGDLR